MSGGLELRYFVLKPAGTSLYARASRAAMFAFCEEATKHAQLGEDITLISQVHEWATRETVKAVNNPEKQYDGY